MTILGAAHYYVWLRFVSATHLPAPWHLLGTLAIIALAPSLPVATMLLRRLPRTTARAFVWLVYTWFGFALITLAVATWKGSRSRARTALASSHVAVRDT